MSRIIIYTNFKMNGHNLVRFQNSLKNSFGMLRYIIFMRWIVFLDFSENNGKSGKDYISQVGINFTCRVNCPILPHFYRILGKMQKAGTKIEYNKLGCIPLTGWILRFYPVFSELTKETENRGEDWLWKARMYPTCGINCQILFYLSLINEKNGKLGSRFDMAKLETRSKDSIWELRVL